MVLSPLMCIQCWIVSSVPQSNSHSQVGDAMTTTILVEEPSKIGSLMLDVGKSLDMLRL